MNLRVCDCCEFDGANPAEKPPSDRQTKLHYVKHGPIQPADGFQRNADGRCFRGEWFVQYSLTKQAAFCFYCRLFAIEGATSLMGGQIDTAYISSGYENWKKSAGKRTRLSKA